MRVCGIAVRNRVENRSPPAASIQRTEKSLNRRVIAWTILRIKAAARRRCGLARRINGPRCATSGLPLFSRSSSNLSDGNIVAHPAGLLFFLANDSAELSSRKIPPIRPLTSRAIQKPSLLRPMKNAGIASLTIPGSRRRNCAETVRDFSTGKIPEPSRSPAEGLGSCRRERSELISCTAIIAR